MAGGSGLVHTLTQVWGWLAAALQLCLFVWSPAGWLVHTLTQVWHGLQLLDSSACCMSACPLLASWCTAQCFGDATLCQVVDTVCGLWCSFTSLITYPADDEQTAACCLIVVRRGNGQLEVAEVMLQHSQDFGGLLGVVPVLGYQWVRQCHACSCRAARSAIRSCMAG